jgi:hypothetical protein
MREVLNAQAKAFFFSIRMGSVACAKPWQHGHSPPGYS